MTEPEAFVASGAAPALVEDPEPEATQDPADESFTL